MRHRASSQVTGLGDDHGLSTSGSSDSASLASSGDTAMTEPFIHSEEAHLHATSGLENGANVADARPEASKYNTFDQLRACLQWSVFERHSSETGPAPYKWFSPSVVPSPAAFYCWRRDQCQRYHLKLGSEDEMSFHQYFIDVNYDEKIRERVKTDQRIYQEQLWRSYGRVKNNDAIQAGSSPTDVNPAQHELYERVDWIFNGVAEAICRHSLPCLPVPVQAAPEQPNEPPPASEPTPRNKKGFPISYFIERNNFHDQWTDYCRTSGLNAQNVLYDYVPFASHNPYSLYHKVKYGDFGSPHPYVPFAITNDKDWKKSCEDQARQEVEALTWLEMRRNIIGKTQRELDATGQRFRERSKGAPSEVPPVVKPTINGHGHPHSDAPLVPFAMSDDALVDQEIEQPQAMGVDDLATPLISTEAANNINANPPNPLGSSEPQQGSAVSMQPSVKNNTTVSAATSISHPITVSIMVPEELMSWLRSHLWKQLKTDHPEKLAYLCDEGHRQLLWPKMQTHRKKVNASLPDSDMHSLRPFDAFSPIVRLKPVMNMAAVVTDDEVPWRAGCKLLLANSLEEPAAHPSLTGAVPGPRWSSCKVDPSHEPPASFKLGNLFLSSCPGKKVRLTGAVRGRGAVCRDLSIDLQRFAALGVGTLVCCLSDAELGVIGVKWEDYLIEADKLGLDLVRVPMVEGNCPTTQEYLDAWLEEIVLHCTLKGVNVLVHCRGGVGRAGTIAACWLIKMGLVDEFRSPDEVSRRGEVLPGHELLWQCLQVVRMRRSSKAIETAEQAAYIAKYGEYLISKWQKHHMGEIYLDCGYRDLVSAYWQRIREETDLWVRQEQEKLEDGQQNIDESSNGSVQGPPSTSAATSTVVNVHHSNCRSKAAATLPGQERNGGSPTHKEGPNGEANGYALVNSPWPHPFQQEQPMQRKASLVGVSFPFSVNGPVASSDSANGHGPSVCTGEAERSLEGEPSRKRRNTNSLNVDSIRICDGVPDGPDPLFAPSLRPASETNTSGKNDRTDAGIATRTSGCNDDEAEMELDAFPVNGRRSEGLCVPSSSVVGNGDGSPGATLASNSRQMPKSSVLNGDELVFPSKR